jgi:cytochrome P450
MYSRRRDPTIPHPLEALYFAWAALGNRGWADETMKERLPGTGSHDGQRAAEGSRFQGALERSPGRARLTDAVAFQRRPLETLTRQRRTGGPLFPLTSAVAGRMLVVGTPELAHEVLHAPPGTYLAGTANRRILPVLPANSVLTLDGEPHKQRRRELAPMFHGEGLAAIAPVIGELAADEVERWPLGRPFAVLPRMRSLALSVAVRVILGIENSACVAQVERHLRQVLRPYSMLSGIRALARLGPLSPQAAADRGHRAFARGLAETVRCRREHPGDEASVPELPGPDEVFALLLAAHETTATGLAWAIELLAWAPHAANAVARELPDSQRPSLDAVIWESLRLRPPLVDIVRQANAPVQLAGRNVAAGTLLLIPPPLIHQEAATEEPDRFDITRLRGSQPDPHTWLPFGGGERRCLGASLAMLELREILPQIIDRFELLPARSQPERPRLYGTALVPASRASVVLRQRRK